MKVLGINDEATECNLCGKQNLKKVVWIEDDAGFLHGHYGTTCAGQVLGWNTDNLGTAATAKKITEKMVTDKKQARKDYFQNECFVDFTNVFIDKKYKIGVWMRENKVARPVAVAQIKEQMKAEHPEFYN